MRPHVSVSGGRRREDQRVDHWLMPGFLPATRSGPGALGGGVAGRRWRSYRKSSSKFFSSGRGDLMAAKDSEDEGGRSAIRPLEGLPELEPWQNLNLSLPWL